MALNSNQIAEILFKKVSAGKATTQLGRFFGNNEEPYSGRSFVDLSQIWVQSNLIPSVAAEVVNVVEKINDLQLINIPGTSSFAHPNLKNVIPFNYGDGSSYAYILKQNNGTTIIPPGVNDWFLDTETGVLTFFAGDSSSTTDSGALPTGVTTSSGPYISCYKYIGKTAQDTGLSGQTNDTGGSFGEWQDSVINFVTSLPSSPTHLNRYILNSTSSVSAQIYNIAQDYVFSGSIPPYSIVEYRVTNNGSGGTAGWSYTEPLMGMFTSIDDLDNSIYFYNTSNKWIKYESEKTYPTEIELTPQETFTQGTSGNYSHIISDITINQEGTPSSDVTLYVNGIKVKDSHFSIVSLTSRAITYSTSTTTIITVVDASSVVIGDKIRITTGSSVIWRVVVNKSGNDLTFSGTSVSGITGAQVYYVSATHSYPQIGDYIMINSNIGYDIEIGSIPDQISLCYARIHP